MINIGIAGVGFMGMVHYLSYLKIEGVRVVALADHLPERLAGDWTGIKGNFGPPGEQMDLTGVATFASPEEMITSGEVDVIDICLPPAAHTQLALAALAAGKHVFCEKPIALHIEQADRLIAAAEIADRQLLIGHVLPYFPEYAWALQVIGSGDYGQVVSASFERVVSDPAWLANYWDADAFGGPLLDLHVHDAHFICLALGMPARVTTQGSLRNGLAEHWRSLLQYDTGGPRVLATSGVLNQPSRPFLHGFEIQLQRATISFEFAVETLADGDQAAYTRPPTLYPNDRPAERIELGEGDPMRAFEAELRHASQVFAGKTEPGPLNATLARNALTLCQLQAAYLLDQQ